MAKQLGTLLIGGKLDGLSFYMSRYGPIVRKIGTVTKERYKTDPAFERRRRAADEFGYAGKLTGLIKHGVMRCCPLAVTGTTHNRLTSILRKTVLEDTVSEWGHRRITAENARLLEGFNWRDQRTVDSMLHVAYPVVLDTAGGSASLAIDALVPEGDVKLDGGATHMELTLALVAVDWDRKAFYTACDKSAMIALSGKDAVHIGLSCALDIYSGHILIAGIAVQGYREVKGEMVPLKEVAGFEIGAAGVGG